MSTSLEVSYLIRLVLEVGAFGAVAAVGLALRRRGRWAALAAGGGCLGLVFMLVTVEIFVEAKYLEVSYLSDFLVRQGEEAFEILAWIRVVALVMIAAAFVACARAREARIPVDSGSRTSGHSVLRSRR